MPGYMINQMKKKLRNGEVVLGSWITISSTDIPEILSVYDFDWFLFDMEHAPLTVAELEPLFQSTPPKITPLVRVPVNSLIYVKQALDTGGHGVMIPMVNSSDDASNAVSYTRYPPEGIRGTGARRASQYYSNHSEYLKTANREVLVIVQIETKEAVNNFENIISVDGVDGWFVGPYDLAASMGHLGEPESTAVEDAMKRMLKIAERSDKPGGTLSFNLKKAKEYISAGFKIMAIGSDDYFLLNGAREAIENIRKEI